VAEGELGADEALIIGLLGREFRTWVFSSVALHWVLPDRSETPEEFQKM
jgi:hypothetical protein